MRVRTLTTELWLPQPICTVFPFFGNAWNLDEITPPWLHFRILSPRDAVLHQGSLIEYRLRWRWVSLHWLTEISVWEPPYRFIDRQIKGPYRQWVHEHTFEECNGGTLVRDRVDYASPGWIAEPLLNRLIVGRDVGRIFEYRQQKLRERFAATH